MHWKQPQKHNLCAVKSCLWLFIRMHQIYPINDLCFGGTLCLCPGSYLGICTLCSGESHTHTDWVFRYLTGILPVENPGKSHSKEPVVPFGPHAANSAAPRSQAGNGDDGVTAMEWKATRSTRELLLPDVWGYS